MTDLISVTVNDGKYTVQQTEHGKWEALRYGEAWPAFADGGPDNLHVALAYEIAALKAKLEKQGEIAEFMQARATAAEAKAAELERERDDATGTLQYCEKQWSDERGTMIDKFSFERARADAADSELSIISYHLESGAADSDAILHSIREIEADRDVFKERATAAEERVKRLESVLDKLRHNCDSAYVASLDQFSKTECLGWEAKVISGMFGKAEFSAHENANRLMGKHQGLAHAIKEMRAAFAGEKP